MDYPHSITNFIERNHGNPNTTGSAPTIHPFGDGKSCTLHFSHKRMGMVAPCARVKMPSELEASEKASPRFSVLLSELSHSASKHVLDKLTIYAARYLLRSALD